MNQNLQNQQVNKDVLVLLAKQPGRTSFSSLFSVKKPLSTQKVGHTGTLDSFAQGLLVVCAGRLTRLAGKITEFSKTYEAIIHFGTETDTLECTGNVVKTSSLPTEADLKEAVSHFTTEYMQSPPLYSAIHIDGKRASDLARSGITKEVPKRKVKVFSSLIKDLQFDSFGKVEYAHIVFSVSKGTYIRSLARDIAYYCKSCAHLTGLLRTKVGNFNLSDAAGFSLLKPFSIKNVILQAESLKQNTNEKFKENSKEKSGENSNEKSVNELNAFTEQIPFEEIIKKSVNFTKEIAVECGFCILTLKKESSSLFFNGAKLHSSFFTENPHEKKEETAAVFTYEGIFAGILQKDTNGLFKYAFVLS